MSKVHDIGTVDSYDCAVWMHEAGSRPAHLDVRRAGSTLSLVYPNAGDVPTTIDSQTKSPNFMENTERERKERRAQG